MRIQELLKEDAREYYDAAEGLVAFCECDGDKACVVCIDSELYGAITTTQQGKPEPKCGGIHSKGDGSWWANDARGIPLARVCGECETSKLSRYRPDVLRNPNYWSDESINEDD